jgi:hypothetical protein
MREEKPVETSASSTHRTPSFSVERSE